MLLVDDDPAVTRAYETTLGRKGLDLNVQIARNGKEAIERVKSTTFDVIVSDISMPEMTGLEFLKTIRARGE